MLGRKLGDFVLVEWLGSGGSGQVFRADQPSLQRSAVVKVLRGAWAQDELGRARFLREARLASRLDHPYAAHVYASGAEPEGELWIAMEWVRGKTLAELVEAAPIPLAAFVPLFDRMCEVVARAHDQGIVHRDLKPANVMVIEQRGELVPKLLDFGLAKGGPEPKTPEGGGAPAPDGDVTVTLAGAMMGTPRYMAPEMWLAAETAGPRADVYALGILAFECLTGQPPFLATKRTALAREHIKAPLPPLPHGLPAALAGVLARATAKKEEDRFPGALELAAALREAAGLGAEPKVPPLPEALAAIAATAPQPIAEAILALEAARNLHEARDAARVACAVCVRWAAIVRLASLGRAGARLDARGSELLRELRRRELSEMEWAELAAVDAARSLAELHAEAAPTRESLAALAPRLAEAASALGPLLRLQLVVERADRAERWTGPRRLSRAHGHGRPILLDEAGRPHLALWPLAQVAPPAPGVPEELFLLAGWGPRGARLVAPPVGFELQDPAVWDHLREQLDDTLEPQASAAQDAPYRGLAPFREGDAERFVGREAEVQAFVNRLRVDPLLIVSGPSGAGKSSFVLAGVLPNLTGPTAVCRPSGLDAALADEPDVLVVDQLEELVTLTADPAERAAAAARIDAFARRPRKRVILTVRDDFLARVVELPGLRAWAAHAVWLLTTPARADLERIVVEPARRAGYDFDDPALPGRMVDDVAGRPAALALLSFTAAHLWEQRDRHFKRMLAAAYDAMGGVGGALARHADETIDRLAAADRDRARDAFRHLVTAAGTRAVLRRADLDELAGAAVVEKLLAARLLASDEGRVEIVHEALLAAWPRLQAWLRNDEQDARLRDRLRAAATAWDESGRPRGLLWRGDALASLERARHGLTSGEAAFADASRTDAARARRRTRGVVAGILVGLTAAVVILLVANRRADVARQEADARLLASYADQGRRFLLDDDPMRALAFLGEALRGGADDPALRFSLARAFARLRSQRAVYEFADFVTAVDATADGERVLAASQDGTVRILDGKTGAQLSAWRPHEKVWSARFCPMGGCVATLGFDKTIKLWRDGELVREWKHEERLLTFAFSPDGRVLAAGDAVGRAHVWDVATGGSRGVLEHAGGTTVTHLAFDRDRTRLLTGGTDGRVIMWDLALGDKLATLADGEGSLVALARAGDVILTARGRTVFVWDATGRKLAALDHPRAVTHAALTADSTTAVTGCADGIARVWDARTGQARHLLVGHRGDVTRVLACGPSAVVSLGMDGVVRMWDAATGVLSAALHGHGHRVERAACAGPRLVTGSYDRTARLWDPTDGLGPTRVADGPKGVFTIEAATDGRLLVASRDGHARVWDLRTRTPGWTVSLGKGQAAGIDGAARRVVVANGDVAEVWVVGEAQPLRRLAGGHRGGILSVNLDGDGTRVVTTDADGLAIVWDVARAEPRARLAGHGARVSHASFSPDGRRVVTASHDRTARVWDADSGQALRTLAGHASFVLTAFFDGTGARVVTGSTDQTVNLWDAGTGELLRSLKGHHRDISSARFSPSGRFVASVGFDDAVAVWDAEAGRLLQLVRGAHVGMPNALTFVDDRTLLTGGWDDGAVLAWNVSIDGRPAASILGDLPCATPFQLKAGQPMPRSIDWDACRRK